MGAAEEESAVGKLKNVAEKAQKVQDAVKKVQELVDQFKKIKLDVIKEEVVTIKDKEDKPVPLVDGGQVVRGLYS